MFDHPDHRYRCEASNPAMAEPKVTSVRLAVKFKPDRVDIEVEPKKPKAGKKAVLK